MRLTSKGQVTIPQHIREKLDLRPGIQVEFDIVGDSVRIRKATKPKRMTRGEMMVEHLRGSGNKRYRSTAELVQLLRGDPATDQSPEGRPAISVAGALVRGHRRARGRGVGCGRPQAVMCFRDVGEHQEQGKSARHWESLPNGQRAHY